MIECYSELMQINTPDSSHSAMDHPSSHVINTQEVQDNTKMNFNLNKFIAELSHFVRQVTLADLLYDKPLTIKDKILAWEKTINQQHTFIAQLMLLKEKSSKNSNNESEQNNVLAEIHQGKQNTDISERKKDINHKLRQLDNKYLLTYNRQLKALKANNQIDSGFNTS